MVCFGGACGAAHRRSETGAAPPRPLGLRKSSTGRSNLSSSIPSESPAGSGANALVALRADRRGAAQQLSLAARPRGLVGLVVRPWCAPLRTVGRMRVPVGLCRNCIFRGEFPRKNTIDAKPRLASIPLDESRQRFQRWCVLAHDEIADQGKIADQWAIRGAQIFISRKRRLAAAHAPQYD